MCIQRILATLGLFLLSSLVHAQQGPNLILETTPEQTEIELEGSVVIGTDGSLIATPVDPTVCQATNSCEGVTVTVTEFEAIGAQNRTITVDEGQSVPLTWASSGATSCTAAGNFSAWTDKSALATDSRDASISERTVSTSSGDAESSPYQLSLQCQNGSVSSTIGAASTLSLVVNEVVEPSPTSCVGRDPIAGWTRLTTGSLSCLVGDSTADCRAWSPNLWSNSFLGSAGISKKILTNVSSTQQYVAIQFNTNGMASTRAGRLEFERAAGFITKPAVRLTISQCPGDFNPQQATGCIFNGDLFSASWRGPDSAASTDCVLQPNSVYYLNILATTSDSSVAPSAIQPDPRCDEDCGLLITTY